MGIQGADHTKLRNFDTTVQQVDDWDRNTLSLVAAGKGMWRERGGGDRVRERVCVRESERKRERESESIREYLNEQVQAHRVQRACGCLHEYKKYPNYVHCTKISTLSILEGLKPSKDQLSAVHSTSICSYTT